MIDGYTAARLKEFWGIGNLSTGLSPYVIQGQADLLFREIERLKVERDEALKKAEAYRQAGINLQDGRIGGCEERFEAEASRLLEERKAK